VGDGRIRGSPMGLDPRWPTVGRRTEAALEMGSRVEVASSELSRVALFLTSMCTACGTGQRRSSWPTRSSTVLVRSWPGGARPRARHRLRAGGWRHAREGLAQPPPSRPRVLFSFPPALTTVLPPQADSSPPLQHQCKGGRLEAARRRCSKQESGTEAMKMREKQSSGSTFRLWLTKMEHSIISLFPLVSQAGLVLLIGGRPWRCSSLGLW
jgi:hypothetical protein